MSKLESRFAYEIAIAGDVAERDRVLQMVKDSDPDAMWIKVDDKYVICTNVKEAAGIARLSGDDSETRKGRPS